MKTIPYICDSNSIKKHYCNQHGSGIFNPYKSGMFAQRGYGIGNMLAGLLKQSIPILKQKVLPYIAKKVIRSGGEIVNDILAGKNIKQSLKSTGKRRFNEILNTSTATTRKRKGKKRRISGIL